MDPCIFQAQCRAKGTLLFQHGSLYRFGLSSVQMANTLLLSFINLWPTAAYWWLSVLHGACLRGKNHRTTWELVQPWIWLSHTPDKLNVLLVRTLPLLLAKPSRLEGMGHALFCLNVCLGNLQFAG